MLLPVPKRYDFHFAKKFSRTISLFWGEALSTKNTKVTELLWGLDRVISRRIPTFLVPSRPTTQMLQNFTELTNKTKWLDYWPLSFYQPPPSHHPSMWGLSLSTSYLPIYYWLPIAYCQPTVSPLPTLLPTDSSLPTYTYLPIPTYTYLPYPSVPYLYSLPTLCIPYL